MRNPGALGSLTLRQTSTTNGHGRYQLAGSVPGRYQNGQGPAKAPSFVNWSCTDFEFLSWLEQMRGCVDLLLAPRQWIFVMFLSHLTPTFLSSSSGPMPMITMICQEPMMGGEWVGPTKAEYRWVNPAPGRRAEGWGWWGKWFLKCLKRNDGKAMKATRICQPSFSNQEFRAPASRSGGSPSGALGGSAGVISGPVAIDLWPFFWLPKFDPRMCSVALWQCFHIWTSKKFIDETWCLHWNSQHFAGFLRFTSRPSEGVQRSSGSTLDPVEKSSGSISWIVEHAKICEAVGPDS